ncbi:MAG TPA: T9SS type A sorting domain-containing protein, partial [Candidatus Kapabacteria bacterium]|nr:T9SS type A sorting domain-containing protein [Candidatus Kapabacteria bacterium]
VSLHGKLFVASNFGGLFYTTNNGKVWVYLNDTLFLNTTIFSLSVRGEDIFANTQDGLYLSTNEGSDWTLTPPPNSSLLGEYVFSGNNLLCLTDTGLFCSSNMGATWTMVDSLWGRYKYQISIIPYTGDTVFVLSPDSSLFISNDGGFHWAPFVSKGSPVYPFKQYYPVGKGALYIWGDSGLFYSSNTGGSWTAAKDSGITAWHVNYFFKSTSGHLYAVTDSDVFISGTNGAIWSVADSGLPHSHRIWEIAQCGNNVLLGTDSGTYVMADAGGVWSAVNFGTADFNEGPYTLIRLYVNSFISIGDTVFAGSNTGFFYSTNSGVSWVLANAGLDHETVPSLAVVGNTLFASHPEEPGASVMLTKDNGDTWFESKYFPDSTDILVSNNKVLLGGGGRGIKRSVDTGKSWNFIDSGITSGVWIDAIAMDGDSSIFDFYFGSFYRSIDAGISWVALNNSGIRGFQEFPALLLRGNNVYEAAQYSGFIRSTDFGTTWMNVSDSNLQNGTNALTANDEYVFAGGRVGIFRSSDSGASWVAVNKGLNDSNITALFANGETIYAGTVFGEIYFSPDNGNHWGNVSDGLRSGSVTSFAICNGYLFEGGTSSGVWRRPLSEMITSVNERPVNVLPVQLNLQQNYPNPFSAATTISYTLPQSADVTLKIFNMLGEEVSTPVSGKENMGTHNISFDASLLPMGVYFYRLQSGILTAEKKMFVVR